MNDRYLFKAKRIDNGEWIVGSLLTIAEINSFICTGKIKLDGALKGHICPEMYAVDENSICKCTGLEDKNGTLIWENDICIYDDSAKFVVKFGEYNEFTDKSHIGFYAKWEDRWDGLYREDLGYWNDEVEVIGSIFDNPELLEVE